jgi:hypothetical protein
MNHFLSTLSIALEAKMSIRKVSNRGGNTIGRLPSLKVDRMVSFESLLERDFIYWLEFEPTVSWFSEQPLTLSYQHGQRTLHYTPDFHVINRTRIFWLNANDPNLWSGPRISVSLKLPKPGVFNKIGVFRS